MLKREEDDLKDAILFFTPDTVCEAFNIFLGIQVLYFINSKCFYSYLSFERNQYWVTYSDTLSKWEKLKRSFSRFNIFEFNVKKKVVCS